MNIRPFSDWVLVEAEPLQKRSNVIELAGDSDTSPVRVGRVLRVGPGRPLAKGGHAPVGVSAGERVAFFRWHQEHRPGKATVKALAQMSLEGGKDVCLIRQADILFAVSEDVRVDV